MHWYHAQCDGDWEQGHGISIETLDNPGWWLKIDLRGTKLEGFTMEPEVHHYVHEGDWWRCWTATDRFNGDGAPQQLASVIRTFREWADRI